MTAARIVSSKQNKKVFFGKPNSLIVIEDICARLTLDQLEEMFYKCLQEYNYRQESDGVDNSIPAYNPIDIHNSLKLIASELFYEELYYKQTEYSASILKKCLKLYKRTAVVIDNSRVDKIQPHIENTEINEFD